MDRDQPTGRTGEQLFAGAVTGRVTVNWCLLEVGAAPGTFVTTSSTEFGADPQSLQEALKQFPEENVSNRFVEAVDRATSATGQAERAARLFRALVEGRVLDPNILTLEINALLDLLERLDRSERHEEALRLARSLTGLLALTLRWVTLVESLRIALRAANALADSHAHAWVLHELGTFTLASGNAQAAVNTLSQALELRKAIGDEPGRALSQHNLAVAQLGPIHIYRRRRSLARRTAVAAVAGAGLLVVGSGLAVELARHRNPPSGFAASSGTAGSSAPSESIDTLGPHVTLKELPSFIRTGTPTFTGSAGTSAGDKPQVTIEVFEGRGVSGSPVETPPPAARQDDGSYSLALTQPLEEDTYTARAEQEDSSGNTGMDSTTFTVDLTPPTVRIDRFAGPTSTTPTFAGTAGILPSDGAITVEVSNSSGSVGSVPGIRVLPDGTWSVTWPSAKALDQNATYTATATQEDEAGNEGRSASITFDTGVT